MLKKLWLTFKNISRWKKVVLGIFLCFSFIILTLSMLVATQTGTRWVVQKGAAIAQVKLGQMKGNLLTGLDIASLDYEQKGLVIHAEKISFRWQPLSLFYTSVSVQSLSAENIRVQLPPSSNEPEPDPYVWPSLAQPVRIELGRMNLRNIQVEQGESQYLIDSLSGSFGLGTFHLRLKNVAAENENAQAKLLVNGEMGLRYPYAFKAQINWDLKKQQADNLPFAGKLSASGNIKTFSAVNDLRSPVPLTARATISPALHDKKNKPIAEIIAEWNEQPLLPAIAASFNPDGKLHFIKPIKTTQGRLTAKGWLDTYDISGVVTAKTADVKFTVDISANGNHAPDKNQSTLRVDKLQLVSDPAEVPDAKIEHYILATGVVDLLPNFAWNATLKSEHVNIDDFVADWPSNINMTFDSQGEFRQQQLTFDVKNINAEGNLRGLALAAEGDLKQENNLWSSPNFKLAVGANQLMLKGQAGKALSVDWKINAPLLGQIDPSIRGSVISTGSLSGDIAKPSVQVNAQINQFSWRNYAVENLTLNLASQAATDKYNLMLEANQANIAGQYLSHLTLKSDGNIEQHRVTGQVDSPAYGTVNFLLDSSWKDNSWRGQWREFTFNTKKIPRWTLLSSTPMQADKEHAELGKLCLTTSNELPAAIDPSPDAAKQSTPQIPEICVAGNWSSTAGTTATANIQSAPLSSLRAWFKPEVTLTGVLEGEANFRAPLNTPATMTANIATRDAKLLYQFQGGNVEAYPLQKGSINATLKNNQLTSALVMDWATYGAVNMDLQYAMPTKKLNGAATIALTNLAPLEGLLPFLNNVQGSAEGKFNFSGTSDKPEITGNFNIANGSANLPKLGLELKNISFQVTSPSVNSAHVEGAITSGDGTLVTQGDFINLGSPDWHWKANVFGAGIRIIQQTQLTATISPNLKLNASAQSIELTGSTEIPWARANIKNLPESATRVSRDVVVVENDSVSLPGLTRRALPIHTNVILYFGDDVRFKGFGLDTRLSGKANILKEENRPVLTTGYVAVDKGIYKAYGQELSIERGRLIFQGPYDNPGLDIRAQRVMENVTAGLDIGGTLQNPKSTVFSIPASSDSEAMAMLLTGKPLSNSSKDDAYAIIGAIGKMGMSQGDSMTSDIVHKFGLDEVSIKADKGLKQSELLVGKNVTPKLFLHYVVGLFDQAFSLGLTYKLNDKVNIEAESGKEQSVDVIYKIER